MATATASSSRHPREEVYPDELLFRHARASVELGPSYNSGSSSSANEEPDSNNNYIGPPRPQTIITTTSQQSQDYHQAQVQGPSQNVEINQRPNATQDVMRLRNQLHASQKAFREERRKLLARIEELEQDLHTLNSQRQDQDDRCSRMIKELECKNQRLSEELTKTLIKNVQLVEENADLKNTHVDLSHRMGSMEDQMQRLDVHNQENIRDVLKRLEKREMSLKNQAKRLAQLESYYTRELNMLSVGTGTGRSVIPELQAHESSIIQIHPQPVQVQAHHTYPISQQAPPPQFSSHAVHQRLSPPSTFSSNAVDQRFSPTIGTQNSPVYEARGGRDSYSEIYYKTVTDKAINLIQREARNCNALLQKFAKPSPQTDFKPKPKAYNARTLEVSSSEPEIETHVTKTAAEKTKRVAAVEPKRPTTESLCNEEEEMLKLLFFKF